LITQVGIWSIQHRFQNTLGYQLIKVGGQTRSIKLYAISLPFYLICMKERHKRFQSFDPIGCHLVCKCSASKPAGMPMRVNGVEPKLDQLPTLNVISLFCFTRKFQVPDILNSC